MWSYSVPTWLFTFKPFSNGYNSYTGKRTRLHRYSSDPGIRIWSWLSGSFARFQTVAASKWQLLFCLLPMKDHAVRKMLKLFPYNNYGQEDVCALSTNYNTENMCVTYQGHTKYRQIYINTTNFEQIWKKDNKNILLSRTTQTMGQASSKREKSQEVMVSGSVAVGASSYDDWQ